MLQLMPPWGPAVVRLCQLLQVRGTHLQLMYHHWSVAHALCQCYHRLQIGVQARRAIDVYRDVKHRSVSYQHTGLQQNRRETQDVVSVHVRDEDSSYRHHGNIVCLDRLPETLFAYVQ